MIPTTMSDNPMRDMGAIMHKVRGMPDSQLAAILSGKDVSVPQYAAMAEAMGRKQLREAMQAQQAQQQAQQPSVKDQLLAAEQAAANPQQAQQAQQAQQPQQAGGIAALPAPNMEGMGEGMAAGGIVAFGNGGDVPRYNGEYDSFIKEQQEQDQKDLIETAKKLGLSLADVAMLVPRAGAGILNAGPIRSLRATGADIPYIPDVAGGDFSSMTPFYDKYIRGADKKSKVPTTAETAAFTETPTASSNAPSAAAANPNAPTTGGGKPSGGKPDSGLPAIDISKPTTFERRANPYAGMSAEKVDVEGLKDKGLGEGLMRASQLLLSKPRLSEAIGAGLGALADQGLATRKEINAAKKDARDYDLLLTKSKEAFEQGQDQLGFHYDELAEKKRHNPIMEQAALITANAHMKSAQGKENAPDLQMMKLAYDHIENQLKSDINFRNQFKTLTDEQKMQYIAALATQNKNIYTSMQSPGKAGAPVKFLGFES